VAQHAGALQQAQLQQLELLEQRTGELCAAADEHLRRQLEVLLPDAQEAGRRAARVLQEAQGGLHEGLRDWWEQPAVGAAAWHSYDDRNMQEWQSELQAAHARLAGLRGHAL
jgi:hypothetical protein